MSDHKVLTTLSDAAYLNAPEYREHIEAVLACYDHPTGILGELVSQMADAFWWVKIYRAEKNHLVVSEMTDRIISRSSAMPVPKKRGPSYTTSWARQCRVCR